MIHSKHHDALTIREIEFSILIKDKDKGFHDLGDLLRAELSRFDGKRNKNMWENPIHDFLKTNIDRSIIIRDSTKVYFLNYQEHGSFTIQFKLLILTRYINYGSTRQALDYLIKDTIGNYFEELLERHLPVSISVHCVDNELYEIPGDQDVNYTRPRTKRDLIPIILASLAILLSLTMGLFWFNQQNQTVETGKPSDYYKEKYFEMLIEKRLHEEFQKEELNAGANKKQELSSDSVQIIQNQPEK